MTHIDSRLRPHALDAALAAERTAPPASRLRAEAKGAVPTPPVAAKPLPEDRKAEPTATTSRRTGTEHPPAAGPAESMRFFGKVVEAVDPRSIITDDAGQQALVSEVLQARATINLRIAEDPQPGSARAA